MSDLTGAIFVEDLNIRTPRAGLPDHTTADGTPYWGWVNLGDYARAVADTLMQEFARLAAVHGTTLDRRNFPEFPLYPEVDLRLEDGGLMFGAQKVEDHGREIVRRFLARYLPLLPKTRKGESMGDIYALKPFDPHSVCVKIPYKGHEISIALDDSCGAFAVCQRGNIKVYAIDQDTCEDVSVLLGADPDYMTFPADAETLKTIFAKIDELEQA